MTFVVWKTQYRCAGLWSCQSPACRFVEACEPATRIIVVDIPVVFDGANAINNVANLVEFKRQLGQVTEIAVRIRAHHQRNLKFGEPNFSRRFHQNGLASSLATECGCKLIEE